MCSKDTLDTVLEKVCKKARMEFGDKLNSVILYGSYAREDYDNESDIDVMILSEVSADEINRYQKVFSDFALELDLQYDIVLSLFLQDLKTFQRWKQTSAFFKNIANEGVEISA